MTTRILRFARTHAWSIFLAQVWLAAFSPLLHAHSLTPAMHPAGLHVHIAVQPDEDLLCPISGLPAAVLTVEVCESRAAKEVNLEPEKLRPGAFVLELLVLPQQVVSEPAARATYYAGNQIPSLSGAPPGITASPQAP
jgi:hypothetical protein